MKLVELEDYEVVQLSIEAIKTSFPKNCDYSILERRFSDSEYMMPISEDIPLEKSKDYYSNDTIIKLCPKKLIECNKTDFNEKSTVYTHHNCTIPRASVRQKYKRVLNPDKADICLIPNHFCDHKVLETAIFIDKENHRIFFICEGRIYDRTTRSYKNLDPTNCAAFLKGTTLKDINPSIVNVGIHENSLHYYVKDPNIKGQEFRNSLLSAELYYCGKACFLPSDERFVYDCMSGKLHNIVTEDVLAETLGGEENKIDNDTLESLRALLTSSDAAVVGLGLKTLSELDYIKYKNSVIYLLNDTYSKWVGSPMKSNTGIKYMLKYLHLYEGRNTKAYTKDIEQEDFDLLKHNIELSVADQIKELKERLESYFPFAKIILNATSSVEKLV